MQTKRNKILSSCIRGRYLFCIVLIVAMALFITGCSGGRGNAADDTAGILAGTEPKTGMEDSQPETKLLGEGSTKFFFSVVDQEGGETLFEIHTDKEIVGEALSELGLIAGEDSEFGLYVKMVNGITADYDRDGKYWAFYINGEYALTGVDATMIAEGESYSFKVE